MSLHNGRLSLRQFGWPLGRQISLIGLESAFSVADVISILNAMTTPIAVPLEFDRLSVEERVAYVQALWDRIAADPSALPVPVEHQRVLTERLSADPASGDSADDRPWAEVRDQLIAELARR